MNNIYMEYLTEDAREDLILEKEMDLINTDIDYLFTTYEAVDNNKKQSIFRKIYEQLKKLIGIFYQFIKNLKNKKRNNIDNINTNIKKSENYNNDIDNKKIDKNIKEILNIEDDIINDCEFILDRSEMMRSKIFSFKAIEDIKKLYNDIEKRSNRIESDIKVIKGIMESNDYLNGNKYDYDSQLDKHHDNIKSLSEKYFKLVDEIMEDCVDTVNNMHRSRTVEQRHEIIEIINDIKTINKKVYGIYFTFIIDTDFKLFKTGK